MQTIDKITDLLENYPPHSKIVIVFQKKDSGKHRPITVPNKELNTWLKLMNSALYHHYNSWPAFMHGGIKKRSYVSYARPHVNKKCVITIDIRECFDSITSDEVNLALNNHLKLPEHICSSLTQKLCFKNKLPQGFATSNYLSNLYLLPHLLIIKKELSKDNIAFTNYVDDLALSGHFPHKDKTINYVIRQLSKANLSTNKAKISVMPNNKRQTICGLVVNKKLTLTRSLKLELLSDIANSRMTSPSAVGWLAHLKNIDPKFRDKFYQFAIKNEIL